MMLNSVDIPVPQFPARIVFVVMETYVNSFFQLKKFKLDVKGKKQSKIAECRDA